MRYYVFYHDAYNPSLPAESVVLATNDINVLQTRLWRISLQRDANDKYSVLDTGENTWHPITDFLPG